MTKQESKKDISKAKAIITAGMGFGDEGKGSIVDFYTKKHGSGLTVRYSGGAQCAHHVVQNDGTHHVFSQFGSGSFHGAKTFLSRFVMVNPLALMREGKALSDKIGGNAFSLMYIDEDAPLTTPYHIAANRIRESARGEGRHGSCGMGIGETMESLLSHPQNIPRAKDLNDIHSLRNKLKFIQDQKIETRNLVDWDDEHVVLLEEDPEYVADLFSGLRGAVNIVPRSMLASLMKDDVTVFEGSQGALLDQDWGFHPHTTWSSTTFNNALALIFEAGLSIPIEKVGVARTFSTRHGHGPFVAGEQEKEARSAHEVIVSVGPGGTERNARHEWQGDFRVGPFDCVMMAYAQDVLGCDSIALTHASKEDTKAMWVSSYSGNPCHDHLFDYGPLRTRIKKSKTPSCTYQEELTSALYESNPIVFESGYADIPGVDQYTHLVNISTRGKAPVKTVSFGPKTSDKEER